MAKRVTKYHNYRDICGNSDPWKFVKILLYPILSYWNMIIMGKDVKEIEEIKGFVPRSVVYAEQINEDFAEGIAGFYKAVWYERDGGLSMKQKHLIVFAMVLVQK